MLLVLCVLFWFVLFRAALSLATTTDTVRVYNAVERDTIRSIVQYVVSSRVSIIISYGNIPILLLVG